MNFEITAILKKLNQEISDLRSSILENFKQIEDNNHDLADGFQPDSGISLLDDCMQANRRLLEENQQALERQGALIRIYNDLARDIKNMHSLNEEDVDLAESDRQELFELAINGEAPLNALHPLYNDSDFVLKVLHYFEGNEAYEECIPLRDHLIQIAPVLV